MPSVPDTFASLQAPPPHTPVSRLSALIKPPAACPGCLAQAGQPWPADTTSRFCSACLVRLASSRKRSSRRPALPRGGLDAR